MKNALSDLYASDARKACQLALRRTAHLPDNDRLEAINTLLRGFGTEAIRGEWQNGYWCDIVATYVNFGDTYSTTVIHQRGDWSGARSRFYVSTMGDFVERNEKKLGIM